MNISGSIRNKLILYFVAVAMVPLILLGAYSMKTTSSVLSSNAIEEQKVSTNAKVDELMKVLAGSEKDMVMLKNLSSMKRLLVAKAAGDGVGVAQWRGHLGQDFASLARSRGSYMQVRLLDAAGMEFTRVDYKGGEAKVIAVGSLQNKGKNSYFTKAMVLGDGGVYYSPLNLNKEHGKVEMPFKPTIRLSSPVFSSSGEKMGAIVLNVAMGAALERFKEASSGEVMLLNSSGFFLASSDAEREWGFMLGKDSEKISKYAPEVATKIMSDIIGIVKGENVVSYQRINFDPRDKSKFWVAASSKPIGEILAPVNAFKKVFFLIVVCVAAAVLFFAFFMGNRIAGPIVRVCGALREISDGDLTGQDVATNSKDELGKLGRLVDAMKLNLSGIVGHLRNSSEHVATATSDLSATASQIVAGADMQANQTSHVATAMEEMSATVIEVAKNSQGASEASSETQQIAIAGGDVVKRAVDGMMAVAETVRQSATTVEALGKSSDEIGAIISVINDIADQTNLLALNAAIEAARAGEQGRGFAVVADEVRKLAEKTTKATKEIADMIKTIQADTRGAMTSMHEGTKQVEEGVQLASEAGESLQQIVSSVDIVTDMVRQIATAAEQQSATTEEISANITNIATVTSENTDGIRQVSASTEGLAKIADELKEIVARFSLKGHNSSSGGHRSEDTAKGATDAVTEEERPLRVV